MPYFTSYLRFYLNVYLKYTMPRISLKAKALKDVEDTIEVVAGCIVLSKIDKRQIWWKHVELLIIVHGLIFEHRYLSRSDNAGRHTRDILDNIIHASATTKCASRPSGRVGRTGCCDALFCKIALPDGRSYRPLVQAERSFPPPPTRKTSSHPLSPAILIFTPSHAQDSFSPLP